MVDYIILLENFSSLGFCDNKPSWFSSYLSGYSTTPLQVFLCLTLDGGFPSDSVLGPLLPLLSLSVISSLPRALGTMSQYCRTMLQATLHFWALDTYTQLPNQKHFKSPYPKMNLPFSLIPTFSSYHVPSISEQCQRTPKFKPGT